MPITLQDAIERAEIMAGWSGDLKQESYNTIVSQLDDKDIYPFTTALVERNLNVRTGSEVFDDVGEEIVLDKPRRVRIDLGDRLARAAQTMRQRSPGGLWVPEQYTQEEEDIPIYVEEPDYPYTEPVSEGNVFTGPEDESSYDYEPEDFLRDELERLGISITPDGQVVFYQSNLPGVYTKKNPMPPMPLETAFKYYDQTLKTVDKEQTRVNELQDYLTKLSSATSEIEDSLRNLEQFMYSPESKTKEIQQIYAGLESVKADISSGDWRSAQQSLDNLHGVLDNYSGIQYDKYNQNLKTMETLDQIMDIKEQNPKRFRQLSEGLGAIPYTRAAAWKRRREMALEDVTFFPVESSNVEAFGYDENERALYVRFLAKGNSPSSLYLYHDVEPEIYEQFFASPSKGKFIWSHLRDRYEYDKLE